MALEDACTARAEKPHVVLIPWDPESAEHCERLRLQRVACGWKMDKIEVWREKQREGKMSIHWAVLLPSDPRSATWHAQHVERYPDEATPLSDSAAAIGGRARDASSSSRSPGTFVPVGHISIDTVASTTTPSLLLADPSAHRFHISAFYVSRAMHGDGIGGVVVREAEDMAVRVLGARVLTLDTLDKRVLLREEDGGFKGGRDLYRRFIGIEPPEFHTQSWYERMGYKVFAETTDHGEGSSYLATVTNDDGKTETWCEPSVWMEKMIH